MVGPCRRVGPRQPEASRSHPLRVTSCSAVPSLGPVDEETRMSAKFLLYTALISLATTVAYENFKARKA
jgi:hypothetical protein